MAVAPRSAAFTRIGAGTISAVAGLLLLTMANAQIRQYLDQCTGKGSVTADVQINACTAVIESKQYSGKDLAFAFNNRGLAYYDKRDFERAIASYNEALELDPNFSQSYHNRPCQFVFGQARLRPRDRRLRGGDKTQS
jgi:tetratricopeptide (TPR) repeat protein